MRRRRENIRTWKAWDVHHRRWQDIIAMIGGIWLIATVPFVIAAADVMLATTLTGWLAFVGGALVVYMTAGAMQDDHQSYSWVAAVGGVVALIGAFVALAYGLELAFWSLLIGGGVVTLFQVWSGALKRRERAPRERRAERGRTVAV